VHYHLAQAYERKGEYDQARSNYDRFLQVWASADPDIPNVIRQAPRV
jgi:outer membrane protein assembly factor BamD (BamD/ComL family)